MKIEINPFKAFLERAELKRVLLVEEWIKARPPGSILLDAGAGHMPFRDLIISCGLDYVSHDFGKYEGGEPWGAVEADAWHSDKCSIICDIIDFPLPSNSFHCILCTEVLEHIYNPLLALQELVRLLQPGGQIFVTVPFLCLPHQQPFFFNAGLSSEFFQEAADSLGVSITYKKLGNLSSIILINSIIRASSERAFLKQLLYYICAGIELLIATLVPYTQKNLDVYSSLVVILEKPYS